MGPLAGVMITDYWIIKKQILDIHELYKDHGIYHYFHGFNWRAFAAWIIGFAPLMPGFAHSINPAINVGKAWQLYTFAWLYGLFCSMAVYYIICTWISPQTESLIDVAVLPPQRGDLEAPQIMEGVAAGEVEKIAITASEKEVRASGSS